VRRLYVIGIGAGDPEQLTLQAVRALGELDVVFVDPARDRDAADYAGAVVDWYAARAEAFEAMIGGSLGPDGCGGILVWGDPSLYDSTLRVLGLVLARGAVESSYTVVPGITSVQALAAAHRVTLTGVGAPVHVTTGRRLAAGMPADLDDVLVMLDGKATFARLPDPDLDIFWGAYLGMPDEILISGDLQERRDEILRARAEARERKGWIMDTYLLHRRRDPDAGP
jgi:precorrin-6A synthase